MKLITISLLVFVVGLISMPGRAERTVTDGQGLNSQILWHFPGESDFISVQSADVAPHLRSSISLVADYYRKPLGLETSYGRSWVIRQVVATNLAWAVGLADRFQFGVSMPVTAYQSGRGVAWIRNKDVNDSPDASVVGDMRIHFKTAVFKRTERRPDGPAFAMDVGLSLPTGDNENFAAENGVILAPVAILDLKKSIVTTAFNVGSRIRSGSQGRLMDVAVGNQMTMGFGLSISLMDDLLLLGSDSNIIAEFEDFNRMGAELRFTIGTRPGPNRHVTFLLSAGGGFSAKDAPVLGVPRFRSLLVMRYQPE